MEFTFTSDTVLAALAVSTSGWSAWTAHRALKMARGADTPAVSVKVDPVEGQARWRSVNIVVTNRSDHLIHADSLEVRGPRGAVLLSTADAHRQDGYGGLALKDPLPLTDAAKTVQLSMRVARAGAWGQMGFYGTRDTHSKRCSSTCQLDAIVSG